MPYQDIAAAEVPGFLARHDPVVLDMRDPASFGRGHIDGAQPVSDALIHALRTSGEAATRPVLVYCYHGISSRELSTFLARIGFAHIFNLEGGWQAWAQFRAARGPAPSPELAQWYAANGFAAPEPFALNGRHLTPLMQAALNGEAAIVDELLARPGIIDVENGDGNTALWFACTSDSTDIIGSLIRHGADIDHANREGVTCLIYAASAGKLAVVRTLLDCGASRAPATRDGFTALDCAATLPVLRLLRPRGAANASDVGAHV